MTVSYITTASNSAAGPTTSVDVTTGMTVQVGDLIVVMCKHAGTASSLSVSDANSVVPSYSEATAYLSNPGGAIHTRTFYGVATSTSALNITMTVGASRTALKCIVSQFRSTKPAGWTLGPNGETKTGVSNSFPDTDSFLGRTSGVLLHWVAPGSAITTTPGDFWTEAHDSTEFMQYRLQESAGAQYPFCQSTSAVDWNGHAMFFSDDDEPTTGIRLMACSERQLFAGGVTSGSLNAFTAPVGSVLVAVAYGSPPEDILTLEYNGAPLTELFQANLSGAGAGKGLAVFMGVSGPDGAAHAPSFTSDALNNGAHLQFFAISGVENSSVAAAHRTIYSAGDGGGGTGANLTVVDSELNDMVLSFIHDYSGSELLVNDEEFLHVENSLNPEISNSDIGCQYTMASGASTVMSWTGDEFCTHVAFALVPAEGPQFVQCWGADDNSGATSGGDVTEGNVLVGIIAWNNQTSTLTSISNTRGPNLTLVGNPTTLSVLGWRAALFYGEITSSGSCHLDPTYSADPTVQDLVVHEYSGIDLAQILSNGGAAWALREVSGAGTGTDAYTSGSFTTTHDGCVIVGFCSDLDINNDMTTGTGFTTRNGTQTIDLRADTEDLIQASAGSVETTFTAGAGFRVVAVGGLALKPLVEAVFFPPKSRRYLHLLVR